MYRQTSASSATVVIAGNPNTGKSTIFNRLTGGRARIGNYPGITVERQAGQTRLPGGRLVEMLDSPGTYSLVARSPEEQLALEAVAGLPPLAPPDLVVVSVDATQLSRNLYLVLQIIELDVPVVVALNMMDAVEASGQELDVAALGKALDVPVVPVSARQGTGFGELIHAMSRVLDDPSRGRPGWRWEPCDPALRADLEAVAPEIPASWVSEGDTPRRRALALWCLLSLDGTEQLEGIPQDLRSAALERRGQALAAGRDLDHEVIQGRYGWIDRVAAAVVRERRRTISVTDRVDKVLLHPVAGFLIFLAAMTVIFQALFAGADPLITLIEEVVAAAGALTGRLLGPGLFTDFAVNGVIQGVGAFVVFLPQILMLFLFIGIMEDTGYMARVAVLMDRIMKSLGLHGRAFVPLLSGYACAVPAILATRTMDRWRDRMLTIMVLPLMTCSARLPVYGLLIAAMAPPWQEGRFTQGLLMAAMYLFGTVMALVVAWVLGRTVFRGEATPLVIEMPPYRVPHWPSVLRMVGRRGTDFMKTAGTIILICSMGLWVLLSFPRAPELAAGFEAERTELAAAMAVEADPGKAAGLERRLAELQAAETSERARRSYAGRFGHAIEPVIEPLGFDWKIGIGIISAFAAREVFVSTMGVVFGVGEEVTEESPDLREKMWRDTWPDGRRVFTPLVCLSLMVFFALACQCMSTLAVVKRETGSWRWPAMMFGYMTVLAWSSSFLVYQGGRLLGFG